MVVGDLDRSLASGWGDGIDDPLLRQDTADAAAGDPARRLRSAASLAERLEGLEARCAAAASQQAERARRLSCRPLLTRCLESHPGSSWNADYRMLSRA